MADMRRSSARKGRGEVPKREEILNVAEAHLTRLGYRGVSLHAIATEVGLSKPSLYHHFPDGKEELFVAILNRSLTEARTALESVISAQESPTEQLHVAVHWLMHEPARGRGIELMHDVTRFVDAKYHATVAEAYLNAHYRPIHKVVAAGVESGAFRAVDPVFVTWSILGLIGGLMEVNLLSPTTPAPRIDGGESQLAEEALDLLLHGIAT
ncbi:TetR/AcrR family transcriptional regulator [Nocardia iowensis]|uniref:TetR/AcrR family transcriptional regulator n=1 Tax=Nocardia iowensis TaxID=204891 RepID=A0ABX8RWI6_NOCIO|nr:TetR/AcrR family transcriptional regulator [Nocardia iowensis]QXN93214.1 TetR/AcrR family transcriptional regulator [Nocardia iowensis]